MNIFILKCFIFCLFICIFNSIHSQTLIMNEVSNGPSGSKEYVEFVVVSNSVTYSCNSLTPPSIDIRGWIFDDNSGYHGSSGIASGAVRFSQNPLWQNVPLGTIILLYNDADVNPDIPADDLSLSDGNCTIIAPISNTSLFEKNTTTPGAAACSYPSTGWVPGGNWTYTALANTSDCARIVNLAGCEVFSVCYGTTDNLNNLIYFSASGTNTVYYFNGIDPQLQTNWSSGGAGGAGSNLQTPGAPNNATNASYIAQFNNGCMPITPINVNATSINAGCTCNGSATASASGSIGGYTYVWYDALFNPIGQTSATASGLCAGVYKVIATSHIGCTDTTSVTISSSSSTSVSVNSQTICAGSSAILTASASALGGTYSWMPGVQMTSSISISPLSTTSYSVTYTLAGCAGMNTGIVTVNPLPNVSVNSSTICNGQTISLTALGAATYSWSSGSTSNPLSVSPSATVIYTVTGITAGCSNTTVATVSVNSLPIITVNSQTICSGQTASLVTLGATTYSWNNGSTLNTLSVSPTSTTNYTVTGLSGGCTNTAVATVSVNSLPNLTVNSSTICAGQTASLIASGASTYSWNTGATSNIVSVSPSSTNTYTLMGTTLGCTNTVIATVSVNSLPIITANSQTICNGQIASLIASGATTYSWDSGSSSSSTTVSPSTNSTYTVTGTTAGCSNTAIAMVSVNPLPTIAVNSSTICSGQSATLTANGATSYNWSNGSTATSIVINPTTTAIYSVTGTALGCTSMLTATVMVNASLSLNTNTPTICVGETATLTASGATTYTWNNGSIGNIISLSPISNSTYTVIGESGMCSGTVVASVVVYPLPIVTVNSTTICAGQTSNLIANGANAYNWSSGLTSSSFLASPSTNTTYTVTGITVGCTNTAIATITVKPLPIVTVNTSSICSGQTTTLTANGANTYIWSSGSVTNSTFVSPNTTTIYTVTGTTSGCTNTTFATVSVNPLPIITVNTPIICSGQTTTLTANGANTYLWNTGSTSSSITDAPIHSTTYTITGTLAGCSNTVMALVSVTQLPILTVNSPTICSGQTASLIVNGATTYSWNTGATNNIISVTPNNTTNFNVVGTTSGCTNSTTLTVVVNPSPTLTVNSSSICVGQMGNLIANGASTYSWNTGATSNSLSVSPSTTTSYSITGFSFGCSSIASSTVTVIAIPLITVSSTTICAGQSTTLTANGAFNYVWSNGVTSNQLIISPSISSTYTVTGNSNGCSNINVASVTVNNSPTVNFNSDIIAGCAPLCINLTDLTTVTNGSISTWSWSFGNGSISSLQDPKFCYANSGLYTIELTITSNNGCSKTLIKNNMINVYDIPVAEFKTNLEETDMLEPSIYFINQSVNAVSYNWNFGDSNQSNLTSPNHSYSSEGVYTTTLIATSLHGCKDMVVHQVKVNGIFSFYAPNAFSPNEDNINDIFMPMGTGWDPTTYKLHIHDRWGNLCFSSEDITKGWNGKANNGSEVAQIDTYTWQVELKDIFNKEHKFIGRVTIIK